MRRVSIAIAQVTMLTVSVADYALGQSAEVHGLAQVMVGRWAIGGMDRCSSAPYHITLFDNIIAFRDRGGKVTKELIEEQGIDFIRARALDSQGGLSSVAWIYRKLNDSAISVANLESGRSFSIFKCDPPRAAPPSVRQADQSTDAPETRARRSSSPEITSPRAPLQNQACTLDANVILREAQSIAPAPSCPSNYGDDSNTKYRSVTDMSYCGEFARQGGWGDGVWRYACSNLGPRYHRGTSIPINGVPQGEYKNIPRAIQLVRPLAECGNADAQHYLARMYQGLAFWYGAEHWNFSRSDVEKAVAEQDRWDRIAADNGHLVSQRLVGYFFKKKEDFGEAAKWFRLASDRGDKASFLALGILHEYGEGVRQDYAEALRFYRLASGAGGIRPSLSPEMRIASMFEQGKGVSVSFSEALKWYKSAIDFGDDESGERELAKKRHAALTGCLRSLTGR